MWNEFDEKMMRIALQEAALAALEDEVPVGAVFTLEDQVIATARNKKEQLKSAQGHAELLCLSEASQKLGRWRLLEAKIYVTLEPCLMCAGALLHSRVKELVFGTRDPKFGAVKSLYETLEDSRSNHRVIVREGLLAEEARQLLKQFFSEKRAKSLSTRSKN